MNLEFSGVSTRCFHSATLSLLTPDVSYVGFPAIKRDTRTDLSILNEIVESAARFLSCLVQPLENSPPEPFCGSAFCEPLNGSLAAHPKSVQLNVPRGHSG